MEVLVPGGIAAASLALTYFVCLRPMRTRHCMMMPAQSTAGEDAEHAEIAGLRAEVAELRRAPASGPHSPSGPRLH